MSLHQDTGKARLKAMVASLKQAEEILNEYRIQLVNQEKRVHILLQEISAAHEIQSTSGADLQLFSGALHAGAQLDVNNK